MRRLEAFFELLKAADLRPEIGTFQEDHRTFAFHGCSCELLVAEHDDFIMFRSVIVPDQLPDEAAIGTEHIITDKTKSFDSSNDAVDPRLPIVTVVERDIERKHTIRYTPIGDPKTWEIGKPYIPRSLLPVGTRKRLQIEVRWDFSAGSWHD